MTDEHREESMLLAEVICKKRGYDLKDILARQPGRKRGIQQFVYTKQLIHYFVRVNFQGLSLSEIGWNFGYRDYATTLHSINVVNNEISTNKDKQTEFQILEYNIKRALDEHRKEKEFRANYQVLEALCYRVPDNLIPA